MIKQFGVGILFDEENENRVVRIGSAESDPYHWVEQSKLSHSDMARYVGIYSSDELAVSYDIRMEGDRLALFRPNKDNTTLSLGVVNVFSAEGLGLTVEDGTGPATQYHVHAGRVTGIVFRRKEP